MDIPVPSRGRSLVGAAMTEERVRQLENVLRRIYMWCTEPDATPEGAVAHIPGLIEEVMPKVAGDSEEVENRD